MKASTIPSKSAVLLSTLLLTATSTFTPTAQAGWWFLPSLLSWQGWAGRAAVSNVGRATATQAARSAAGSTLTRSAATGATSAAATVARKKAVQTAIATGLFGTFLGSAVSANPVPEQAAAVEEELQVALTNGDEVYRSRICTHPMREEFFSVPMWTKVCPDGSTPRMGEAIDLREFIQSVSL